MNWSLLKGGVNMAGYDYQHLEDAMIQTFLTVPYPGYNPGSDEYDMTLDLIQRIGGPIHQHVVSWWNEQGGGIFPDEMVKMAGDDPIAGYLGTKIDDDTIKYNEDTFQLYVNAVPLASDVKLGGVQVGVQPFLYLQGNNLMLNAEADPLLVGGNNMVPTSRAVKMYVDNVVVAAGSGGDMYKSTYDTGDNGVVDDAEKLNTQPGSYYLTWANFTSTPTTLGGYGITDAYTKTAINAFFEGEDVGKKQVDWARITNKPNLYTVHNNVNDRVITGSAGYDLYGEPNLTFNGSLLTITGDTDISGTLSVDIITEFTGVYGIDIIDPIRVDQIDEYILHAGVTIEGVLLKDNKINWSYISNTPTTFVGYGISDTLANLNTALSDATLYKWEADQGAVNIHGDNVVYGSIASTACVGNDARLSDARTPLSHTHGNITNAGAIGATINLPIITTTAGVLIASSFGIASNTFCEGDDSRLSDARTPTAHILDSASHTVSGLTAGHFLKALTATTFGFVVHGLGYGDVGAEQAFSKNTAFNKSFGTGSTEVCVGNDSRLSDSRIPTAHASSHITGGGDIIATATISAVGLLPILSNTATQYLDGTGNWTVPAGGGGGISWTGSTANGIGTYVDANTINAEAKLGFDGTNFIVGRSDLTAERLAIWVTDTETHIKHWETGVDATAGHGELIFEVDAAVGQATDRGGIRFKDGAGGLMFYLDNYDKRAYFSGKVGIGQLSPSALLDLKQTDPIFIEFDRTGNANINTTFNIGVSYTALNDDFMFFGVSGGTDDLVITDDGFIGINDTSPSYRLDVNGTGRFTGNLYCNAHIYQGVNDIHYFGTDFSQIYHNDTDFIFKSYKHGGRFLFQGENLADGISKALIYADPDGAVQLYHAGTKKLETTSTGITVTGDITVSGIANDNALITTDAAGKLISETGIAYNAYWFSIGDLDLYGRSGYVSEISTTSQFCIYSAHNDVSGNSGAMVIGGSGSHRSHTFLAVDDPGYGAYYAAVFAIGKYVPPGGWDEGGDDLFVVERTGIIKMRNLGTAAASNILYFDSTNGTLTYGVMLSSGNTNNNVVTATGGNQVQGEADLTFDGDKLYINADQGIKLSSWGGWGQTYSTASQVIGSNIYVNSSDTVNRQVRSINTHASYGHAYIEFYGGDIVFNCKTEASTADAIVVIAERMRIDGTNGYVGINQATPGYQLDINGTGRFVGALTLNSHIYQGDSDFHYFGASNDAALFYHPTNGFYIQLYEHGKPIYIRGEDAGGTDRTMILADPDGGVWLYHNGALKFATQSSGVDVTGKLYCDDIESDVNVGTGFAATFFNDGNATNRYGIKIQCGIDITTPLYNYPIRFYDGDGHLISSVQYNNTNIAFTAISDVRLKENIKNYDIDGLSIINQMRYRSFNWKKDKKKLEIHGWVAQEVEKIFPEMVSIDPETRYKMIARETLIPVMMAGIKQHYKITESHEDKIIRLEKRVGELENEIKLLKAS